MRSERGDVRFGGIIGILILVFAVFGLMAVCDGDGDNDSLGKIQLVNHERERCYYDECEEGGQYGRRGGDGSDYGGNRRDDRNRNRGAFSPGPFDRSPIDFSGSCISLDCSGRERDRERREQAPEMRPASLFPPSFDGVKAFVLNTIKSGIEMGRLFADTTITFVENLLFGIA